MGTGHATRCLAVAQALRDDGVAAEADALQLACTEMPEPLAARWQREGAAVAHVSAAPGSRADADATTALAARMRADWVVADGYAFGADFLQALCDAGLKVALFDDYGHAARYPVHVVVNQNVYATPDFYPDRRPDTTLLLGCRYAVLRREFLARPPAPAPVAPRARHLVVTLGGTDPDNATGRLLTALQATEFSDLTADIVVGAANRHLTHLREQAGTRTGWRVLTGVDDMRPLMERADLALASGGTTVYELAYLGVPMALVELVDNQTRVVRGMAAAGAACDLGATRNLDPARCREAIARLVEDAAARGRLGTAARALVDGAGVQRLMAVMGRDALAIRPARSEDCRLYWEWANDPEVRRASFTQAPIPWEAHRAWFARRLADPSARLYVVEAPGGRPAAQVRYEAGPDGAVVSVSVADRFRGCGLASHVLEQTARRYRADTGGHVIHAYIRPDNGASRAAFRRAGYASQATVERDGVVAEHLVLNTGNP